MSIFRMPGQDTVQSDPKGTLLGEHTAAVCAELLGLGEAAVADLVAEGVLT